MTSERASALRGSHRVGSWVVLAMMVTGCAHAAPVRSLVSPLQGQPPPPAPLPQVNGTYYRVQPGESLWRIAHDFGWDARSLARANHLTDSSQVSVGQLLFIPPPAESTRFLWPARGSLNPARGFGSEAAIRGLRISAPEGTLVRASRTGRVAVATHQLGGLGKAVVLDHGDGYVSVYAGLDQLLVSPGMSIQQGNPVGKLGRAPLYFEIRRGTRPDNPLQLLP